MNAYERMTRQLKGEPVDRPPNVDILMQLAAHCINGRVKGTPLNGFCAERKLGQSCVNRRQPECNALVGEQHRQRDSLAVDSKSGEMRVALSCLGIGLYDGARRGEEPFTILRGVYCKIAHHFEQIQ